MSSPSDESVETQQVLHTLGCHLSGMAGNILLKLHLIDMERAKQFEAQRLGRMTIEEILTSLETLLHQAAQAIENKEDKDKILAQRITSDLELTISRFRTTARHEELGVDVTEDIDSLQTQKRWLLRVFGLIFRQRSDVDDQRLSSLSLRMCEIPVIPWMALADSQQLTLYDEELPDRFRTPLEELMRTMSLLISSIERGSPPTHFMAACWPVVLSSARDRLNQLLGEIREFSIDPNSECIVSELQSINGELSGKTLGEELVPDFDAIPTLSLFTTTLVLKLNAGSIYDCDELTLLSKDLARLSLEISGRLVMLAAAEELRQKLGFAEDDPRKYHEILCRGDYDECPLRGINHYLLPAVRFHADDQLFIVMYVAALIGVGGTPTKEVATKQAKLIRGMLEAIVTKLEIENHVVAFNYHPEMVRKMEYADVFVAKHLLAIVFHRIVTFANTLRDACREGTEESHILQVCYEDIAWCPAALERVPELASFEGVKFLLGGLLRQYAHSLELGLKQVREDVNFESQHKGLRDLLRKVSLLHYQLFLAYSEEAASFVIGIREPPQKFLTFELSSTRFRNIWMHRNLREGFNLYVDKSLAASTKLQKLLRDRPDSFHADDEFFTISQDIATLLNELRTKSAFLGEKSLFEIAGVLFRHIEIARTEIRSARRLLEQVETDSAESTLKRVEAVKALNGCKHRLRLLLLHFDDLRQVVEWDPSMEAEFPMTNIGRGSFGTVFKFSREGSVVLKQITVNCDSNEALKAVAMEVEAMGTLKHEGVVPCEGMSMDQRVFGKPESTNMSSEEFYEKGTLREWLMNNNRQDDRPIEKMKVWLAQLCDALAYVHRRGLIHRDIKPDNIFLSDDERMVIGDFGLVSISTSFQYEPENNSDAPDEAKPNRTSKKGTLKYMAPEVMTLGSSNGGRYGNKADVYSLGVVYSDMVESYPSYREFLSQYNSGEQVELPKKFEKEVEVIRWLTKRNPDERPSCAELLESDYLKDVDYKKPKSEPVEDLSEVPGPSSAFLIELVKKMYNTKIRQEEQEETESPHLK